VEDARSEDAGKDHQAACDDETFCWSIESAQEECVSVVGFPGREKHREGGDECGESTSSSCAETHGCSFEKAAKCTVQRVYAVTGDDSGQLVGWGDVLAQCYSSFGRLLPNEDVRGSRTYSNSSPSPLDVPVLLACFPSMLSIVE